MLVCLDQALYLLFYLQGQSKEIVWCHYDMDNFFFNILTIYAPQFTYEGEVLNVFVKTLIGVVFAIEMSYYNGPHNNTIWRTYSEDAKHNIVCCYYVFWPGRFLGISRHILRLSSYLLERNVDWQVLPVQDVASEHNFFCSLHNTTGPPTSGCLY